MSRVREVHQSGWDTTPVEKVMTRPPLYTVTPKDDLYNTFRMLAKNNINQVLVVQGCKCAGLLTRADILNHLQHLHEFGLDRL